jgi:hypothetical protein
MDLKNPCESRTVTGCLFCLFVAANETAACVCAVCAVCWCVCAGMCAGVCLCVLV